MPAPELDHDLDRPGNPGVLRDVIQVQRELRVGHPANQLADVVDQSFGGDVRVEERRQHQRAGEPQLAGGSGQAHRLFEGADPRADHETLQRQARLGHGVHQSETLPDAERCRFAGGAEQVDGVAAAVEQRPQVRNEPRGVRAEIGVHRGRRGRDDAADANAHEVSPFDQAASE